MSTRCSCCDIPMTWREFKMVQDSGEEETMCSSCLNIVYYPDYYDIPHYQFADITEMTIPFVVTPIKRIDY